MKTKLTTKQLITMAGIIAVGVVLALLITLVKPRQATGEQAESTAAEKPAAAKAIAENQLLGKPETTVGKSDKNAEKPQADNVNLTDAQVIAAGIAILKAGPAKIHTTITLPGEIRFNEDRTAQVVPLLSGTVQVVQADVGQIVKKGQTLAIIASTALSDQRSQLLTAERRAALTKTTLEREKKLWEEKISAEQDYLQAQQAWQEAEIDRNNAQQKLKALGASRGGAGSLNSYELHAPFDGVVVEKHISMGQSVKEDTVLFTVSDLSTVWAEVAVPASDLNSIRVGETVTVKASAFDANATGKIAYIGSLLGAQTRTATARVVLTNPASSWRPGLFVNVEIEVSSDQQDVPVAVESSAIQTIEDKPTVFARIPGGFEARRVTLGRSDSTKVAIVKGFASGEQYAAAGSFVIKAELGKSSNEDAD